nr:NDM-CcrA_beta_lactamase [uncultured bacterium]
MVWMRLAFCFLLGLTLCPSAVAQERVKIQLADDVFIEKLEPGVWRHVSYKTLPNLGPVPSNGGIITVGSDILLIDSAWNNEQTKLILDWSEKELRAAPSIAVITHAHEDRIGGIHELHRRGIRTVSSKLTAELAKQQGLEVPQQTFEGRRNLSLGGRSIEVYYPGPGHTKDNVVVWIPDKHILFGGCLIKAAQAQNLGNIKEADLEQWPKTVETLAHEFKEVRLVVPGHGDPSGSEAMTHTLELLEKAVPLKPPVKGSTSH